MILDPIRYDIIIIGSGSGANLIEPAIQQNKSVALVDKGPAGGTCLNVGCIPSKLLIAAADRVMEIKEAEKFGITAPIEKIDFSKIMQDMREYVSETRDNIQRSLQDSDELDYYDTEGRFIDHHTIEVNGKKIYGDLFFIASGSRPNIPDIDGLSSVPYITNETLLELNELPQSVAIIGGGYIAMEYAHFLSAMGSKVMIIQRNSSIIPDEEPEMAALLHDELSKRVEIITGDEPEEVRKHNDAITIQLKSGQKKTVTHLFIAAGRKSNADMLDAEAAEIGLDEEGYIKVDGYLATSQAHIYAFGDAIGKAMFTHAANEESRIAWNNAFHDDKIPAALDGVPHAIYSYPPLASVGMTEKEAKENHEIRVGKAVYKDVAKGNALRNPSGFAKLIVDKDQMTILGLHVIGPYAPILIHEIIPLIGIEATAHEISAAAHIHPSLSELITRTVSNLRS